MLLISWYLLYLSSVWERSVLFVAILMITIVGCSKSIMVYSCLVLFNIALLREKYCSKLYPQNILLVFIPNKASPTVPGPCITSTHKQLFVMRFFWAKHSLLQNQAKKLMNLPCPVIQTICVLVLPYGFRSRDKKGSKRIMQAWGPFPFATNSYSNINTKAIIYQG
jgi:hypothetical protein